MAYKIKSKKAKEKKIVRYDLRKLRIKKDRRGYKCAGIWFINKPFANLHRTALIKDEETERERRKK